MPSAASHAAASQAAASTAAVPVASLQSLCALQRELDAHTSAPAAFDAFAARMGRHGFRAVFAGRLSLALLSDLPIDPVAFSNVPEALLDAYLRDGLYTADPVFAHARLTARPFRWREATGDLTDTQAAVVAAFAQSGFTHGLCVPVDRVGSVQGVVSLGREGDFALSPEARVEIEMLSRTLMAVLGRLLPLPEIRLSQRERDVLALVAQGKTNWEAGQILGVSEYSVRDYLRALSERLHTSNRTHTVVRAVQLGLIPA